MRDGARRPYFLWDEDVSIDELRAILSGKGRPSTPEEREVRLRLLGKMLREARDIDVWTFITPEEVAKELPLVARRVGRRLPFWQFLLDGWRQDGLLSP